MTKVINMSLNTASIEAAIKEVRDYQAWIRRKTTEFVERLANEGAIQALMNFETAQYDGERQVDVNVEDRGDNTFAIVASGETVLLIEFGSGIVLYGSGHPKASEMGYGPGTYPGQTHVPVPGYWWFKDTDGKSHYSVGNAPSLAMFNAAQDIRQRVVDIAREVFSS